MTVRPDWRFPSISMVSIVSAILLLTIAITPVLKPELTPELLKRAAEFYMAKFPHWIIWSVSVCIVVALAAAIVPSVGSRTLSTTQENAEFSYFSWFSMIFGAGMGIGLFTWGIAEPLAGMQNNPDIIRGFTQPQTIENIPSALKWSYAHWGFAGWSGYAILGLAVAYTGHRKRLPLTLSTALMPLFGKTMKGSLGQIVDIATVVITALSIIQIVAYALDETAMAIYQIVQSPGILTADGHASAMSKLATIAFIMSVAAITSMTGVARGIKYLSNVNMLLSFAFLTMVLVAGSFKDSINALLFSTADYIFHLPSMMVQVWSKDGSTVGDALQAWQGTWSMFHWACWWVSFSPFIGIFLAKISRGRSVRQYLFATIVLPALFTMIWMSWVGGSAITMELNGNANGAIVNAVTGLQMFSLLSFLFEPWAASIASVIVIILLVTYLLTTVNSALVVATEVSNPDVGPNHSKLTLFAWAALITAVLFILLAVNSFSSIRSLLVIASAPISVLVILLSLSLAFAVYKDNRDRGAPRGTTPPTPPGIRVRTMAVQIS